MGARKGEGRRTKKGGGRMRFKVEDIWGRGQSRRTACRMGDWKGLGGVGGGGKSQGGGVGGKGDSNK